MLYVEEVSVIEKLKSTSELLLVVLAGLVLAGAVSAAAMPTRQVSRRSGTTLDVAVATKRDQTETVSMEVVVPGLGPAGVQELPDGRVLVKVAELAQGGSPGEPMLPCAFVQLLLPPEADLKTVKVKLVGGSWEQLPGEHEISPAPPAATWVGDKLMVDWGGKDESVIVKGRDSAVYRTNAYFPTERVRLVSVGAFRQWKLAKFKLCVATYNPASKKVRILREPRILLTVRKLPGPPAVGVNSAAPALPAAARFARELSDRVANPQDLETFYGSLPVGTLASTADYVIITTNAIQQNCAKLADFISALETETCGHTVKVVTESDKHDDTHYLAGDSPDQRADNIRYWLEQNYLADGIDYVLLIGNPDPCETRYDPAVSVPMKMCWPMGDSDSNNVPTDMYYAELSSSDWDSDGDSRCGEFMEDFSSTPDQHLEVKVGRIPFYFSCADLESILQKTMDYGLATSDLDWRRKVLIPAAISNFGPQDDDCDFDTDLENRTFGDDWGEAIKWKAHSLGYSFFRLYEREGIYPDQRAISTTSCEQPLYVDYVAAEWQDHYGFVTWWAHGSPWGASRFCWIDDDTDEDRCNETVQDDPNCQETEFYPLFDTSKCYQLDDAHPSFVFQISCMNAWPEASDNLAYSLLKRGAIGTFAATRVSWYQVGSWDPSSTPWATCGDNASYGYCGFSRMAANYNTAAEALEWCRENSGFGWAEVSWMNMLAFNLYGEPSLSLEGWLGLAARDPSPPDGAINEPLNTVLSWTCGSQAQFQDVYFGTDETTVKDATTSSPVYKGRQHRTVCSYDPDPPLELGQTCYWRIDGIKDGHPASPWKGVVWSFTVEGKAYDPDPADGADDVPQAGVDLGWTPWTGASYHRVYLSDSLDAVNDRQMAAFKGRQPGTTCNTGPLSLGLFGATPGVSRLGEKPLIRAPTTVQKTCPGM
jgi:hypothetical protein